MVGDISWTLTAGVGLAVGVAFGILVELRYVVLMDRKIERLLEKIKAMELRELEKLNARKAKAKATVSRKKKAKKKKK